MNTTAYRRAKRRKASYDIAVVDVMREETIGKIGNLSETGMLLILGRTLNSDALYQLHFKLPDSNGKILDVDVGAHELWSEEASAPGQIWTGLRFIDVSPQSIENIRTWVEQPGSHYV